MSVNRYSTVQKNFTHQTPNSIHVYIAFYCYFLDFDRSVDCSLSFLSRFTGPFTHVILCLNLPTIDKEGKLCTDGIHITNKDDKKILYGKFKIRQHGFSYLPIPVTASQYETLISHCNYLSGRADKTTFDAMGMYGLTTCSPCNKNKNKWFCSQLIAFLLRECGILKGIDPSKVSGNDLFLILYPLSNPEQITRDMRADIVYRRLTGLNEIPVLSEYQLKLFQLD